MEDAHPVEERRLLYDPLFEHAPDTVIRDSPEGGFFGKAVVKKTVFVVVLSVFVGISIALSFSSLTRDRFSYAETGDGMRLTEFIADKYDSVLEVGPVFDEDGGIIPGKTVTEVGKFAICCNDYTSFIFIGKDVREMPDTAFYTCGSLLAVIVDPGNENFLSEDGVLYRKTDGRASEVMLYPARNYLYRAMLTLGEAPPADAEEAKAFASRAEEFAEKCSDWLENAKKDEPKQGYFGLRKPEANALRASLKYAIPDGVTRVGDMAFAENKELFEVTIPEGVTEFGSMCFFKCSYLARADLPDSTVTIGSDAFSYCARLAEIFIPAGVESVGHHAFYGCDGAENVKLAVSEADAPETGEDWLPKKRRFFLHDVPVAYGCERGAD